MTKYSLTPYMPYVWYPRVYGLPAWPSDGAPAMTLAQRVAAIGPALWWDVPDLTYMRQTRAGGTAPAVGSVVGTLVGQDAAETFTAMMTAQSELVVNGDFATDTVWTKGTGWAIAAGAATATAASSDLSQAAILTVGSWYEVTYTVSGYSAGTLTPKAGSGASGTAVSANGTYSQILQATTSTALIFTAAGFTGSIDNVSAKLIPTIVSRPASDAARPILRQNAGVYALEFDRVDDEVTTSSNVTMTNGAYVVALENGIINATFTQTGATLSWPPTATKTYAPPGDLVALLATTTALSTANTQTFVDYCLELNGNNEDFAGVTSMVQWFRGWTRLKTLDASGWDTSAVTSFSEFAFGCTTLTTLNVSGWDTGAVTNFAYFAQSCTALTALDVSGWDTSKVTSFYAFVYYCPLLTTLDVSGWNTGAVTNFAYFAQSCTALTTLDVSAWDTSKVTTFGAFVSGCTSLTALDVSGWNTSAVTSFAYFAQNCTSLTTVTVTGGTGSPFSDSPCTNYTGAFLNTNLTQASIDAILVAINAAGTSNGTFNQSGGSAPSVTGQAAITAMRARGWTVTVTGGF